MSYVSDERFPNGLPNRLIRNYFHSLVNCYFKILPIREMLGCGGLLEDIKNDPSYMTLLSILQYFIDHPDCDIAEVRREVFRAIRICNKIAGKYGAEV